MKKLTMRTSMLGLFALSAAVAGCAAGSADDGSVDPSTGSAEQAWITPIGAPIITGCGVAQMFALNASAANQFANSAQNSAFVAATGQNLSDLALQLFTVDQAGNYQAFNQAAQTITAAQQSMLASGSQSSSTLANQSAAMNQMAANSVVSNSAVASANDAHWAQASNLASGFDNTTALQSANSYLQPSGIITAQSANAFNNSSVYTLPGGVVGGAIVAGGLIPTLLPLPFVSNVANAASQNAFAESLPTPAVTATNAAQTVSHVWNANQASNVASGDSMNTANTVTNAASTNALQNVAASNLSSAAQQGSAFQNAATAAQNSAFANSATGQIFNNLSSQQLQNSHLLVSFTSTNNQAAANIFTGAGSNVFANQVFSPGIAGCGL